MYSSSASASTSFSINLYKRTIVAQRIQQILFEYAMVGYYIPIEFIINNITEKEINDIISDHKKNASGNLDLFRSDYNIEYTKNRIINLYGKQNIEKHPEFIYLINKKSIYELINIANDINTVIREQTQFFEQTRKLETQTSTIEEDLEDREDYLIEKHNLPLIEMRKRLTTPKIQCPICLEKTTDLNFITLRCGHKFCILCFDKLYNLNKKISCPLCRSSNTYFGRRSYKK